MRRAKKLIVTVVLLTLCINMTSYAKMPGVTVENQSMDYCGIYDGEHSETVAVDGINYKFIYSTNEKNQRVIDVVNEETHEVEKVTYDEESGDVNQYCVYGGEDTLGQFYQDEIFLYNAVSASNDRYKYIGTTTKNISWESGIAVATLAAVIAAVMGLGAAEIIKQIGVPTLTGMSVISAGLITATVKYKAYEMVAGKLTSYKFVWSIKPNGGKTYGDYTSYVGV